MARQPLLWRHLKDMERPRERKPPLCLELQEWACVQEDHYAEGQWRRAEGRVMKGKRVAQADPSKVPGVAVGRDRSEAGQRVPEGGEQRT